MWPFSSRRSRGAEVAPEPKDLPTFSEFARNDASIKVWLPTVLTERLDWISKRLDVSRPDVLRALLFEHLYGRVAYMALLEHDARRRGDELFVQARRAAKTQDNVELAPDTETLFSRSRSSGVDAELIGKPADNLRLELPRRMRIDLVEVARVHRLTKSHYVRKMLVQQLLGERVHTTWQVAIGKIGRDIEQLECDD